MKYLEVESAMEFGDVMREKMGPIKDNMEQTMLPTVRYHDFVPS